MAGEVETKTVQIPFDEKLNDEIKKIIADGWGVVPGSNPHVTLDLVRAPKPLQMAEVEAKVTMTIDDSKVHILRDGKLLPN